MSFAVLDNVRIATKIEASEGVYNACTAADFLCALKDGGSMSQKRQLLERKNATGNIGLPVPLLGMKTVSAQIGFEFKSSGTAGVAPECGPILQTALGATRGYATAGALVATGSTGTGYWTRGPDVAPTIILATGTGVNYHVGDAVTIRDSVTHLDHTDWVTAVSADTLTLLVGNPAAAPWAVSSTISPYVTYLPATNNHPSLTVERWIEDSRLETATGCKVQSLAFDKFTTGSLPEMKATLEGLGYGSVVQALGVTPTLDPSKPSVVLSAYVYQNGVALPVDMLGFSIANTLAFITATQNANGRNACRVSQRKVTFTMDPYKSTTDTTQFTNFDTGTTFSMAVYAATPVTVVNGVVTQWKDAFAVYMPNCFADQLAEGNKGGVLQDKITGLATTGNVGDQKEIYITLL